MAFFFGMTALLRAEAVRDGAVEVELVVPSQTVQPGVEVLAFLKMTHDPEWHSYWVSSTTGYPTTISLSANGAPLPATVAWPVPKIHEQGGIVDYVYEGAVAIPVSFAVSEGLKPGDTLHLSAEVGWLMCREECVPGHATLSLDLAIAEAKPKPDAAWLALLKDIRAHIPTEAPGWSFDAMREGGTIRLLVTMPEGTPSKPGTLHYFASDGSLVIAASQPQRWLNDRQVELTLSLSRYAPAEPEAVSGILSASDGFLYPPTAIRSIPDGSRAASDDVLGQFPEVWQSVPAVELPLRLDSRAVSGAGIWGALLFGVLGGLILNLMPCVFPILGIKVMSFAAQAGKGRRAILAHAAVFTGGVLAALWVLAGIVLALRGAGEAVGWGFQLQNPYVLFLGMIFFLLFGLNMLGVFEIGLGAGAVGGKLEGRSGLRGAFLSGLVAVVVATPCSAPFLGTAVGYAFTQGAFVFFAIFTAVGLGFSLPYFLLAAFPKLLAFLPKPGMWMVRLRQVLSLLLFATVAYLVWILRGFYNESGGGYPTPFFVTVGFVTLAAVLYGRSSQPIRSRRAKALGVSAAGLLLLAGIVAGWPYQVLREGSIEMPRHTEVRPAFGSGDSDPYFVEWTPGLPEKLAAEGKTVFVDFTARWCATCQVNKKLVFSSAEVRDYFRKHGIVVLEADWTRRDPAITAELARRGRFAVPYNVIYAPGREPVELPTVLTPGIVLDALRKLEESEK